MRLFVAITPTEEIQAELRRVMEELRPLASGPRWVRGEGLHLTLKFLGEVQDERLAEIVAALKGARSAREIALRIRGLGTFPNPRHARVIWAGVEAGAELAALAADIEARMALLGFASEERAYAPHVTLARMQSREPLEKLMSAAARFAQYDFGAMTTKEFQLFRSSLKPSGAEYRVLESFTFATADAAEDPR
jgi:2'-5' RNA ligase